MDEIDGVVKLLQRRTPVKLELLRLNLGGGSGQGVSGGGGELVGVENEGESMLYL
jgi:hypothetical protein